MTIDHKIGAIFAGILGAASFFFGVFFGRYEEQHDPEPTQCFDVLESWNGDRWVVLCKGNTQTSMDRKAGTFQMHCRCGKVDDP